MTLKILAGIGVIWCFLLAWYAFCRYCEWVSFNEGECPDCLDLWDFVGTTYGKRIYRCPECSNSIEISTDVDREFVSMYFNERKSKNDRKTEGACKWP